MAKRPRSDRPSPSGEGQRRGPRSGRSTREATASPREGERPAPPSRAPSPGAQAPFPRIPEGFVVLGEFGRAHSLKGEVRLKSSTADPLAIVSYSPLRTDDGRKVTLTRVRPAPGAAPDILIAVVEGVTTREAAEALNRTRLLLERDRLPPAEDEDEFLLADLVGLSVETPDGKPLGRVVGVPNYGGGDLLEIAPVKRGPTGLLPFTKAFVPVVDIKAGRIVADAPDDLFTPAKPQPDDPDAPVDAPPRRPKRKPETPR